jgi:hypothetical protein
MTSRKVVTRSGRNYRGNFPSKKLNRMVEWESLLERDAILHFEFSSGVVDYQEQPEVIHFEQDGETRRYYPDFALTLKNDEVIHFEIKPVSKLHSSRVVERLKAITQRYKSHSAHFRILTDQYLRQQPRLTNLRRLASVVHLHLEDNQATQFVRELINCGQRATVTQLAEKIGMVNVLRLIAHHYLHCDLNLKLEDPNNYIRMTEEADHDAVLI